jgi:hypothetical protein
MNKAGKHRIAVTFVAVVSIGIAGGSAYSAEDTEWTLLLEPMYMDASGNDRQVLLVRRLDLDATPSTETAAPVALDTEATLASRFTVQYQRADWQEWTLGLDFIFFATAQGRPTRTDAADGPAGPIDQVIFEVADRTFTSNDPAEVLGEDTLTGYVGQSVVFGSTNLSRTISDFTGAPGDPSTIVAVDSYRRIHDAAIPITEFRIRWLHPVSRRFSVGATANASIWSDVPVPPAIEPGASVGALDKNTVVFFGVGAAVEYRF